LSKFSLLIDLLIATVFYGLLTLAGGFLLLLFWSGFSFDWILRGTVIIGAIGTFAGAAIPFTRNLAVSIFSVFATFD